MKEDLKICERCKDGVFTDQDKYVTLNTYEGKKTIKECYYHFECFVKWHNEKVKEKAQNTIKAGSQNIFDTLNSLIKDAGKI